MCERCGDRFTPKRQTKGRFCSADCYHVWWKTNGQIEYSKRGLEKLDQLRRAGKDPRATEQATWKRKMAFRATALSLSEEQEGADDLAWAERGAYWQNLADPPWPEVFLRKPRHRYPLVIAGHGVRLRIDRGALLVRHGLTHHPQEVGEERFFPGDPRLPSRIVLVDSPSGFLTFDVVAWLAVRRIPLVVLDWRGRVVSTLGPETRSPDPHLRNAQLAAQGTDVGSHLAAWLIASKLRASVETLQRLPASARVRHAIDRITNLARSLCDSSPRDTQELLMVEARGALIYFGAWLDLPIRWKGTGRRPVPPEWLRMPLRQSLVGGSNRNSGHPVSSALNYAYALAESAVREAVAITGLDPDIAFLHASKPGRSALIFDLMEPIRSIADQTVHRLIQERVFAPGDVALTERGVCRLNPDFARYMASGTRLDDKAKEVTEAFVDLLLRSG